MLKPIGQRIYRLNAVICDCEAISIGSIPNAQCRDKLAQDSSPSIPSRERQFILSTFIMGMDNKHAAVHDKIVSLVSQDPGLPRKGPSVAFWQEPTHAISNIQSPQLPTKVDIAIVGSGITGCSVARTLLSNPKLRNKRIALFEARALTSGATGRNGGHLVSPAAVDFAAVASLFGAEKAAEVTRFSFRNLERFHAFVSTLDEDLRDASEVRKVQKVMNFLEAATFNHFKESLRQFSAACPELVDQFKILSADEAKAVSVSLRSEMSQY